MLHGVLLAHALVLIPGLPLGLVLDVQEARGLGRVVTLLGLLVQTVELNSDNGRSRLRKSNIYHMVFVN